MKSYAHFEMMKMSIKELQQLKRDKTNELGEVRNKKYVLIGNIISIQRLIEEEGHE